DAIEVVEIEVGREQGHRDRRLVEVDTHRFLHTRLIAHNLAGADAADGDLALSWAEIGDVETRHIARDVDDVGRAGLLDVFAGERGYREGNLLQRRGALLRRDDDLFVDLFVCGFGGSLGLNRER